MWCPSLTGNPQSGPLAYGGSLTRTMALLPGSSAIDAGDDANCPATDQRGVTRPQGSHCDMGAYENEQAPAIFITDIPNYGWPLPDPYPNDANDDPMLGWVNNVIPPDAYKNYYVTCYIYVPDYPGITGESGWWVKPTYGLTKTSINPDGTWKCDVTTGGYDEYATKYRAYLFPTTLANPPMLPPADCERPSCVEVLRDDISPPETTITTCPDAFTVLHDVSFEFHSSHTGNLFNCMLDGVENACTSPQSFNNLEVGEHTFSVYATDRVGNVDPSPASCTWEVYVPSMVSSITHIDPNPASAETVRFIVTFSETVTGVDLSDFALTTTGAVDAWIANVSGTGTAYTVTVKIKTGKGTLRLDVVDDDSIKNLDSNPLGGAGLGNGNFADGEMYFIDRDPSLHSMILAPVSLRTQSGSVSGSLPTLGVLEQNGTEDNPAVYITFQTPGTNYLGYLSYRLPGTVKLSTIASLNLQVNFKGPASSTQLWTWSVYDWTMRRWVKLGDTTGLSADVWQTLTFGIRNPGRVISVVGRELRIRLQSNNPAGDAKVDYMVVDLNYRSE
ncbi:MAG: hypothetical protein HXY35_10250 [Chloroflexi bacterium]|nr:hypothetical protein [Chloroflexota bacterium]